MLLLPMLIMSLRLPVPFLILEQPIAAAEAAVALGLSPVALAAAGCDDAASSAILADLDEALMLRQRLADGEAAWQSQADVVADLADALRNSAGCDGDAEAQYATATQNLAMIESDLNIIRSDLLGAALSELPQELVAQIGKFTNIPTAPALPERTFALGLNEDEREALAAAYSMVAWADRTAGEIDQQVREMVAEAESEPAVVAAQANIDAHLDEVQDEFDGPG